MIVQYASGINMVGTKNALVWNETGNELKIYQKCTSSTYSVYFILNLYRQSNQHWNCFKGNIGETPERRGGVHMGLPERIDTILS